MNTVRFKMSRLALSYIIIYIRPISDSDSL